MTNSKATTNKDFYLDILRYQNKRYLWLASALTLVALVIFLIPHSVEPRNGGTWQGYTLGTIGALLIVWLLWLGVRKRSYGGSATRLQAWVSAHVYLGIALAFIGTFHSAFQFGFNIHTLAYVLMMLVIASGIWGLWAYLELPSKSSKVRDGLSREAILDKVSAIDKDILLLAKKSPADVDEHCQNSIARTQVGGTGRALLSGLYQSSGEDSLNWLADKMVTSVGGKEAERLQSLIDYFSMRQRLLAQVTEDMRLHAWLRFWLYLHVPLSVGLFAALTVHIVSVFAYW